MRLLSEVIVIPGNRFQRLAAGRLRDGFRATILRTEATIPNANRFNVDNHHLELSTPRRT
jgi:hypothetical protein